MNEKIISVLRNTRTGLQILSEPIDRFNRWINYKSGYPPLWLRQKVGGLNDFESSGAEYLSYLKILCNLDPGDRVLDIGCGCGLLCLTLNENPPLPEYLGPEGRYVGIDVDKRLVEWCNKHIRKKYANCQFKLAGENLFEYKFDVVVCKSIFTHLLLTETLNYLEVIKKCLAPGGTCLTTWFLLDESDLKGRYTFKYKTSLCSFERESKPKHAVAYRYIWIIRLLKTFGFEPEVYLGSWRGDKKGLSFQDIIILRRKDESYT